MSAAHTPSTLPDEAKEIHVSPSDIAVGVVIGRSSEFFDFFVFAIASVLVFPKLIFPWADPLEATVAATLGVIIAILGLVVVRAMFLESALRQFYQANLIAKVDYADIVYIAPLLFLVGVVMAGLTAYATLRLYIRR